MSNINASKKVKTFVDISLAFSPNPVTGDLTVLKDERAINNSIKNIIMTVPGEVPFNRDMGSLTTSYLFDLVDQGTASLLEEEIKRAIAFNEPRARTQSVKVDAQPSQNQFSVNITYKIVGYNEVVELQHLLRPTRL